MASPISATTSRGRTSTCASISRCRARPGHAIAIRGQFAFSGGAGDSGVPFYMLPRLGGSSTLRAYETSRFTDHHAMVFAAEYRYLMTEKLQLVGFLEGGQVAPRVSAFDFPSLQDVVWRGRPLSHQEITPSSASIWPAARKATAGSSVSAPDSQAS